MGDRDIAHAWAHGKVWFKVPPTVKIILKGVPLKSVYPKDVVLKMLQDLGANGLLGFAAEIYGDYVDSLSIDGRITIASMATEMGGIIILFPSKDGVIADEDAEYEHTIEIDIDGLEPMISRPGHPEDVTSVKDVSGTNVDSGFIGSCTNGRMDDMRANAKILKGKKIAHGRILKIVPSTDMIWKQCLDEGLIEIFKKAGALIGSAGCAGCAAGQIGQTGSGEIAVSSGNRNFVGKQGRGDMYLASPATVAASLVAGYITTVDEIPDKLKQVSVLKDKIYEPKIQAKKLESPLKVQGRAWVIKKDNIDTDMIFHNRYLSITNIDEMGQYTFDNLKRYENFVKDAKKGDIVIVGKNFGCGSSRLQAPQHLQALGVSCVLAESFGKIFFRNSISIGFPVLLCEGITEFVDDDQELEVDLEAGVIKNLTTEKELKTKPLHKFIMDILEAGGILNLLAQELKESS